jgi:hypothetical protein
MTQTEMYKFNHDAMKSPEMQKYLDTVFQGLVDRMTEKLNDSLLNGVEGLSKNLYEYSLSRGFQYSEAEALASLESAKPYFKEKIKESLSESLMSFQKQLTGKEDK